MIRRLVPTLLVSMLVIGLGAAWLLAQEDPNSAGMGQQIAQAPGGPGGGPGGPGGPMGGPGGGMGPGGMGPGGQMPHPGRPGQMGPGGPQFEQMGKNIQFIGHFGDALFNPRVAGLIAVGSLKDELRMKPEDKIKFFEAQLGKTKTLGLRNAMRMILKDLYKAQGDDAKAADQLKAMLEENDAAAAALPNPAPPKQTTNP